MGIKEKGKQTDRIISAWEGMSSGSHTDRDWYTSGTTDRMTCSNNRAIGLMHVMNRMSDGEEDGSWFTANASFVHLYPWSMVCERLVRDLHERMKELKSHFLMRFSCACV